APGARPGAAQLQVDLLDPGNGQVLATSSRLAEVRVLERVAGQAPASAKYPLDQLLGPAIRLIGFDVKPDLPAGTSVKAGDPLTVTLLWQAESEPGKPYT